MIRMFRKDRAGVVNFYSEYLRRCTFVPRYGSDDSKSKGIGESGSCVRHSYCSSASKGRPGRRNHTRPFTTRWRPCSVRSRARSFNYERPVKSARVFRMSFAYLRVACCLRAGKDETKRRRIRSRKRCDRGDAFGGHLTEGRYGALTTHSGSVHGNCVTSRTKP